MFPHEILMQIKQVYPLLSLSNADTCVSCIKISLENNIFFSNTILNILSKEQMVEIEMIA